MSSNYTGSTVYGNLPAGGQPLSDFDGSFGQAYAMGTLMCSAAGTNMITLTSLSGYPTMTAYGNNQKVGFIAANTTTSVTQIEYSALGMLNAYLDDGATQIGSSPYAYLKAGYYYEFAYNSTLNSSAGGWQLSSSKLIAGINNVNVQTFTTSGTYTPTTGMVYCIMDAIGGGGGGGGAAQVGSQTSAGGGGSGATYARVLATAAQIGASQSITIGGAGTGGNAGNHGGNNGGPTSISSLVSCPAGLGGGGGAGSASVPNIDGLGGLSPSVASISGVTAILNIPGGPGQYGFLFTTSSVCVGGAGGSSVLGFGAPQVVLQAAGANGSGYGSGGGGAAVRTTPSEGGGNGTVGLVIVTEFIAT